MAADAYKNCGDSEPPLISVVLAVRNGEAYLDAALRSVYRQTLGDFELIVVNDGSTDATARMLAEQTDPRIRVIHNERGLGLGPSFNKGILAARGKFIARHDADDLCRPDRFAKQVEFLEAHPQVALVGSGAVVIDRQDRPKCVWKQPTRDIEIKWALIYENPIIHSSVMMRKSALDAVGIYSPVSKIEDHELWVRIADRFPVANLDETLVSWREHPGSFSDVNRKIQKQQLRDAGAAKIRDLVPHKFNAEDWETVRNLFFSPANVAVDLNREQLGRAMSLLGIAVEAFYRRHPFSGADISAHRKKLFRTWARHLLALAVRGRGHRNLACRGALVSFAARQWMQSLNPETK